ncbi:MAG: hypothetical protein CMM07_11215 [Rhodopirellula sp.]|nr:hypothetical protein [Rhodopirellula sp.]
MKSHLRTVFGCDARSLAIFRMAIASLILFDVCDWFLHWEQYFSSSGLLDSACAKSLSPHSWSLNYLSDSPWFTWTLLSLLAASCLAVFFGWKTKVAMFTCWVLLVSFHTRNPLLLISGDSLLRMMLLWAVFIPTDEAWSLDGTRRRGLKRSSDANTRLNTNWVCTAGTVCLLLQVCMMYWCAGFAKLNDIWFSGSALDYVLRTDVYTRPFGIWLREHDSLTKTLSFATPWVEIVTPFLLFSPWRTLSFRVFVIAVLLSLHTGIELALNVGKFGVISLIAWLPFLPPRFWTANLTASTSKKHISNDFFLDRPTGSGTLCFRKPNKPSAHYFAFGLLFYVAVWNLVTLVDLNRAAENRCMPSTFYKIGEMTKLSQKFFMFAEPPRHNTRFVFRGTLTDETDIELRTSKLLSIQAPLAPRDLPMGWVWKKVHRYILSNGTTETLNSNLLRHYTERWNNREDKRSAVVSSRLILLSKPIRLIDSTDAYQATTLTRWNAPVSNTANREMMTEQFEKTLDSLRTGPLFPQDEIHSNTK